MTAAAKSVDGVSRREFLNYVWGSSMALVLAQGTGIAFWFALPRLREFTPSFSVQDLPAQNQAPIYSTIKNVRFFITHSEDGIAFLDARCSHLHCDAEWHEPYSIFACPCLATPAAPRWQWRFCPAAAWDRSRPATLTQPPRPAPGQTSSTVGLGEWSSRTSAG